MGISKTALVTLAAAAVAGAAPSPALATALDTGDNTHQVVGSGDGLMAWSEAGQLVSFDGTGVAKSVASTQQWPWPVAVGRNANGSPVVVVDVGYRNKLRMYDSSTGAWSTLAPALGEQVSYLSYHGASVDRGRIAFVFGEAEDMLDTGDQERSLYVMRPGDRSLPRPIAHGYLDQPALRGSRIAFVRKAVIRDGFSYVVKLANTRTRRAVTVASSKIVWSRGTARSRGTAINNLSISTDGRKLNWLEYPHLYHSPIRAVEYTIASGKFRHASVPAPSDGGNYFTIAWAGPLLGVAYTRPVLDPSPRTILDYPKYLTAKYLTEIGYTGPLAFKAGR